jgi:hypothetical protein
MRLRNAAVARVSLAMTLLSALLLMSAPVARAAQWTVTSIADSGPGSLRDTIAGAAAGDTIDFSLSYPATITLTGGPLTINTSVTISGPGTSQLSISGNNASKIFVIASGSTVAINGLAIQDGYFGGLCCEDIYYSGGGAIEIQGGATVTLTAVAVSNSSGAFGGGISNWGTLTIEDSVISNNSSCCGLAAGGIANFGTLTVNRTTFSGNSGYYDGGGILNDGTAAVNQSTFSGNAAAYGAGGGIKNAGTLTVINSTFSGNSACGPYGPPAYSYLGLGGGIANGGGAYGGNGTANVTNSTFSGNCGRAGGAVFESSTALLTLKNTILANSVSSANCYLQAGNIASAGYNLSDDDSCSGFLTVTGDLNSTSAGLDPSGLQNNGGPTQNIALANGSPAVDAIPVAACTDTSGNFVAADQRGALRPYGPGCDIGAFELGAMPPPPACSAAPTGLVAWWPGDGNGVERINQNNATAVNAATFGAGLDGQSFQLDANGSYFDAGNGPTLNVAQGDFTVMAWVRFNALSHPPGYTYSPAGDMSIVDKMDDSQAVNGNGWRLLKQSDNHFWFCTGAGPYNNCGGVHSATVAQVGPWYHVVGVKYGSNILIYVNGVYESTVAEPPIYDTDVADLLIGANKTEGAYLNGNIDEVMLYNRALSAQEIAAIYQAGSAGVCKNQPPVAVIAPVTSPVECSSHAGTPVTFDGSGSHDPDGDTLTYLWTDENAKPAGTTASITPTVPLGTHSYNLQVSDLAGLTSTASAGVTVRDTAAPALSLSTYSITVTLPTATATGATVDLSGIASATDVCDPAPAITNNAPALFPAGTTTVVFTATDASGNSSTANLTVNVVYDFGGYLAPILGTGQSLFKSGRTIPVKFQLTAVDGSIITNAIATLQVFYVASTPSGTIDETVATLSSGGSNTGNQFRFDPTSGQYIYNLNTTGYAAGTYLLRVTLNDGTTHDVTISIH